LSTGNRSRRKATNLVAASIVGTNTIVFSSITMLLPSRLPFSKREREDCSCAVFTRLSCGAKSARGRKESRIDLLVHFDRVPRALTSRMPEQDAEFKLGRRIATV
jgi:hypothetical protein